jgi:beta-lactamase class A
MRNRRLCLQLTSTLGLGWSPLKILAQAAAGPAADAASSAPADALHSRLAGIEQRCGGQLGLRIVQLRSGRSWGWRQDERFAMCSSFKLLLAAQALHRAADGQLRLDEFIRYGRNDLMAWSPITEKNVRHGGMRIGALCAATLATSDNTAANLLIARLGGTASFTAYMRSLGDEVTRLDRTEPAMNAPDPLGVLDTSSPRAMAYSLQRLLLGDGLPPAQQDQLKTWLKASITGERRLKAGLPAGWSIAAKTGTSDLGSSNDVGVVWSPAGEAWVVAAFIRNSPADYSVREACLADLGRLVVQLASNVARA